MTIHSDGAQRQCQSWGFIPFSIRTIISLIIHFIPIKTPRMKNEDFHFSVLAQLEWQPLLQVFSLSRSNQAYRSWVGKVNNRGFKHH
jgi:hypothetical protein